MGSGTESWTLNTVIQRFPKSFSIRRGLRWSRKPFDRLPSKMNTKVAGRSKTLPKETKSPRFSFSLWKDVTYYLKSRQLDKATEAKSFLEQRQREVAKERAERSVKWQTKVRRWSTRTVLISLISSKYFTESGEQKWTYENKLIRRLTTQSWFAKNNPILISLLSVCLVFIRAIVSSSVFLGGKYTHTFAWVFPIRSFSADLSSSLCNTEWHYDSSHSVRLHLIFFIRFQRKRTTKSCPISVLVSVTSSTSLLCFSILFQFFLNICRYCTCSSFRSFLSSSPSNNVIDCSCRVISWD